MDKKLILDINAAIEQLRNPGEVFERDKLSEIADMVACLESAYENKLRDPREAMVLVWELIDNARYMLHDGEHAREVCRMAEALADIVGKLPAKPCDRVVVGKLAVCGSETRDIAP